MLDPAPQVTAAVARGPATLALANLLDNAVKFSAPKGLVTVYLASVGAHAVMSVSDEGPGVSISEFPYLFERFFRGSAARSGDPSGVGLGLALSQAIVQAHGGRIVASNLPTGGALFTVRLPLAIWQHPPTSALLASSAGLGWSAISTELRSHEVGETPWVAPQHVEICLVVAGNEDGLVGELERESIKRQRRRQVRSG